MIFFWISTLCSWIWPFFNMPGTWRFFTHDLIEPMILVRNLCPWFEPITCVLTPMLMGTASLHICLWEQHPYTYAYGNSILTPMRTRTASLHLCLWEQHLKLPWCYFLHHSSDCIYELCPARSSRWNSVKTKDLGKLTYYSHKHWCSCRMAGVYKRKK